MFTYTHMKIYNSSLPLEYRQHSPLTSTPIYKGVSKKYLDSQPQTALTQG